MDELIMTYDKYINKEYDIADVSRILSYIALSDELDKDVEDAEYQIEKIRFLSSVHEQREEVKRILMDLIEKCKKIEI